MAMVETGYYGAKIQSWNKANPRGLLKRIIDEHPKAPKDTLLKLFKATLSDDADPAVMDVIIEYWFSNNYHSLIDRPIHRIKSERAERQKQLTTLQSEIKTKAARMVLLDMMLPNGKPLKDSTGKDCKKAGGWLLKVAAQLKPNQVVGKVLSESDLRMIFAKP